MVDNRKENKIMGKHMIVCLEEKNKQKGEREKSDIIYQSKVFHVRRANSFPFYLF